MKLIYTNDTLMLMQRNEMASGFWILATGIVIEFENCISSNNYLKSCLNCY
jgi:hypothetical protein